MNYNQNSSTRRKLPARYSSIITPFILSVLMTFVVSFVATVRNLGMHADLPYHWVTAWAFSWVVAFPTLLLVLPVVRRIVSSICESTSR
ncbi:DUF2798 domain-containing protein [Phyllobacterium sp. 0TCS1.6C]|uniref:DUF2798 domain-containing protein n=1 Tax=unclassified Phyllobacterium TaxID=2638441 RepID=UPI00226499CF|nr:MULTISPECIES: DUF2798 domain-containing protein [unclassified Phyllobacterium]MCX8282467.1 DUF2798 domain-containing protein [Phyllobacterium sp. 0TCS1.6C]MCX8292559.1 DUF2798 domain-containing protein [Phyllobacterium sp. 0TCS1.6A]